MKANEAPEKIYVKITHPISDEYTEIIAFEDSDTFEDGDGIEYVRTDAFIEKATRFLNCRLYDRVEIVNFGLTFGSTMQKKEFVDNFRKYMKGGAEWTANIEL